jgi:hypothetical protein
MAGAQVLNLAAKRWPDKTSRLADGFYKIKGKDGQTVPFRMNEDQAKFHHSRHGMDVMLKARQKGFTTYIQLDMLDDCLFMPNTAAGVIAHNLTDAKAFFADKIKFAYDNLPIEFRAVVSAEQDAADSMKFSNGSSIRVGTSLRSGNMASCAPSSPRRPERCAQGRSTRCRLDSASRSKARLRGRLGISMS